MDTRNPLRLDPEPAVLSVSFNESGTRLICGLDNGVRMFRAHDCIRTLKESPEPGYGVAIAAALDDRYIALVGGGRKPNSSPNKLQFWDNLESRLLNTLDFAEPILGLRVTAKVLAVILRERTVYLQYTRNGNTGSTQLGSVLAVHDTAVNPYALCSVRGDISVLPGLTYGQVQIIRLHDKTKKIIRAHTSELRQLDLSQDGTLLATASKQGTLLRVFSTTTLSRTHEFRRGVDAAIVYSLSISPLSSFLACTSDKGTLHIFDLRTTFPDQTPQTQHKRTSTSRPLSLHPASTKDLDTLSLPSQSSRPHSSHSTPFAPPADIAHSPPSTGPSALAALAKLPGMPRALSDTRSLTSAPYALGSDPSNWQGQPAYITTTLPNGQKARVKTPVIPLPGMPDGRPMKGVLCWDPEAGERRLWCVGGGAQGRWEVFELRGEEGRERLGRRGWRGYLGRQFEEDGG
ncbi:WD40-repeat-containing domain protein [Elsinoe ampelina]|uniref:WD40-repeat-containing domain protein n=1 Tax=Elsinoe ampelina TaxID=302913 RepID=A0A6A6GF82_9PEZI|nr:WD40-repeat-containing domain protein [Elsinoe ampelina]